MAVRSSTARPLTRAGTAQGGAGTRGPMWLGFAMPPLGLSLLLLLCLVLLLVLQLGSRVVLLLRWLVLCSRPVCLLLRWLLPSRLRELTCP